MVSLQREIVGGNVALLKAEHSMRAENMKKERKQKKVNLVCAVVLSHCHCFFLKNPYSWGRQGPEWWRHTRTDRHTGIQTCHSVCIHVSYTRTISHFLCFKQTQNLNLFDEQQQLVLSRHSCIYCVAKAVLESYLKRARKVYQSAVCSLKWEWETLGKKVYDALAPHIG